MVYLIVSVRTSFDHEVYDMQGLEALCYMLVQLLGIRTDEFFRRFHFYADCVVLKLTKLVEIPGSGLFRGVISGFAGVDSLSPCSFITK